MYNLIYKFGGQDLKMGRYDEEICKNDEQMTRETMYKRDVQMRGLRGGGGFFHARELPQFFDKCCEGTTRDFLTSMPDSGDTTSNSRQSH